MMVLNIVLHFRQFWIYSLTVCGDAVAAAAVAACAFVTSHRCACRHRVGVSSPNGDDTPRAPPLAAGDRSRTASQSVNAFITVALDPRRQCDVEGSDRCNFRCGHYALGSPFGLCMYFVCVLCGAVHRPCLCVGSKYARRTQNEWFSRSTDIWIWCEALKQAFIVQMTKSHIYGMKVEHRNIQESITIFRMLKAMLSGLHWPSCQTHSSIFRPFTQCTPTTKHKCIQCWACSIPYAGKQDDPMGTRFLTKLNALRLVQHHPSVVRKMYTCENIWQKQLAGLPAEAERKGEPSSCDI